MATNLLLPDGMAPSNLHLRSSVKVRYVDGDLFDICERLAEISPDLYIVELSEDDAAIWAVMENCVDGTQRIVCKVGELDARVLTKIRYLMRVPFEQRLKAIDEENARYEQEYHDNELERIYDQIGGQFHRQLWHDGFIEHRPTSYPKVGVAAPGKAR